MKHYAIGGNDDNKDSGQLKTNNMKHRLKYLAAVLFLLMSLFASLVQPIAVHAASLLPSTNPLTPSSGSGSSSGGYCSIINPSLCKEPVTGKPVKITKACPSSLGGFPTTQNPNLTNLPTPDDTFVQCEIYWAQVNLPNYVPGTFNGGGGGNSGVADYCHRNFTSSYLDSCNKGYADGPGASCGNDNVCKVGAYARIQLDASGQNNSDNNPASSQARSYCNSKNYTGDQYKACVKGYDGQTNGTNKNDACKNLNGNSLNICQAAWDQSKSDSGGGGGGVQCNLGISLSFTGILNALNPLNWLLCGIIQGLNGVVQGLDDQINNMLAVNTDQIFGNNGYEQAWGKFENIALGLLVIVGLIIVIAQALGMEILDAYTIRKMLPRVLIATVAIVLSWQLMKFAVTLSNDLGWGVDKLIQSSFPGSGTTFTTGSTSIANNVLVGFASAAGIAVLGLFGLMSFAGTAAIAVIITFLVLILRQIAVIMLMVFAPIAIIAYILPNTQRLYKFWWESFSKMLLMFPMIVGFIAIAHVFSGIASKQSDLTHQVIAFIAYFGPYFAIPLTFRFAGSIMGTIGNAVNSRGEGARGLLRNFRSGQAKKNLEDLRTGHRLNEDIKTLGYNRLAKRFNRATAGTANLKNAGYNPRRMRSRMQTAAANRDLLLAREGLEKNPEAKLMTDDLYESMFTSMGGGDTDDAVRGFLYNKRNFRGRDLEEGVATVRAFRRSMGNTHAAKMGAFLGDTKIGTAFKPEYGGGGAFNAAAIEAAGGDRWTADQMLAEGRSGLGQERRYDIMGGSYTKHEKLLMDQMRNGVTPERATEQLIRNSLEGQSGGAQLSARRQSQEATYPVMHKLFTEALASKDPRRIMQEVAINASRHDVAAQVSPESGKLFAEKVLSQKMAIRDLPPDIVQAGASYFNRLPKDQGDVTLGDLRDAVVNDQEYRELHREYYDRFESEARAAAAGAQQTVTGQTGQILPPPGTT